MATFLSIQSDNLIDNTGVALDWQRSVVPRSYLWVQGPGDSSPSPDSRRITLALIKYQGLSDTSLKPQFVEIAEDRSVVLKTLVQRFCSRMGAILRTNAAI